ncbi:MAG: biotin--[acetyl-CoA-carboxylase] ligase [Desulfotomaculum sp.]|nr:biotin--[acetyl-CoA-carboxylase] ligase [Desulfotomaculum sp.]
MKDKILNILKKQKDQWVSGEDICRRLNVSRTAVWKHIRTLKQQGYEIETQPRRGYRLITVPDLLYPQEIAEGLKTKFIGKKIIHRYRVDSTNDAAKELARNGAKEGTLVITEQQTSGKGRLGRRWHSAYGKDILMSVILRPEINPAEIPQVSMMSAVAAARAVEHTCQLEPGIKWPNDLLVEGRKLSGILVEMGAEIDRVKYVVLGIGINVNSTSSDWPDDIKHKTTSIHQVKGTAVSRLKLLQNLLEELEQLYEIWQKQGFQPILELWRQLCVSKNCPARVDTIRKSYTGWIDGVNENGELLLRLDDGKIIPFSSGDVSLRL